MCDALVGLFFLYVLETISILPLCLASKLDFHPLTEAVLLAISTSPQNTQFPLSQIQLESKLQSCANQKLGWGNH
jgi:hypothetical protein